MTTKKACLGRTRNKQNLIRLSTRKYTTFVKQEVEVIG